MSTISGNNDLGLPSPDRHDIKKDTLPMSMNRMGTIDEEESMVSHTPKTAKQHRYIKKVSFASNLSKPKQSLEMTATPEFNMNLNEVNDSQSEEDDSPVKDNHQLTKEEKE